MKIKSAGFMDLNVECITSDRVPLHRIAMSHYYKHPSGDLIPDPDMEVIVDTERKIVYPVAYQDAYGYYEAYAFNGLGEITFIYPKKRTDIEQFFAFWLKNLRNQGFKGEDTYESNKSKEDSPHSASGQ